MAAYYGTTKEAALDRIISKAEVQLWQGLGAQAWQDYEKGLLREDGTVVK